MENELLIGVRIVLDTIIQGLQKKYQQKKPEGVAGYAAYSVIIAATTMILYAMAAGFNFAINETALVTGLMAVINKRYAIDASVEGNYGAYCFYINVFLLIGWGIYFLFGFFWKECRRRQKKGRQDEHVSLLYIFPPRTLALILMIAVVSAVNTLFQLYAMRFLALNDYTVITSSAGLVTTAILSRWTFHTVR